MLLCSCEADALTLMRLRYWPGMPKRPQVAFSFALMDWMEALLLEFQVAVQDFATAVEVNIRGMFQKVSIIESVDSISRDERGVPLTQYITNARISRARYTITHFKHHHHVLQLISN